MVAATVEPDDGDKAPPFWEWMSRQHLNADAVRAEAARYIASRWDYGPWYRNNQVLRALESENSPYANGLRLLMQDYSEQFDVSARDQMRERLGVVSPLVPVGREECNHPFPNGKRCTRDAIPGAGVCSVHGGSWITEAEREAMASAIQQRLIDLSTRAVTVLADLMDNAKSEKVRFDAAVAVLDRSGIGAVTKVEVSVTQEAEAVTDAVRARLEQIRARAGEKEKFIDAEVISDTADEEPADGPSNV